MASPTTSFYFLCRSLRLSSCVHTGFVISSQSVCFLSTVTELFSLLNNASALSFTSSNKQRTSSSVKLEDRCLLELSALPSIFNMILADKQEDRTVWNLDLQAISMTQFSSSLFEISGYSRAM